MRKIIIFVLLFFITIHLAISLEITENDNILLYGNIVLKSFYGPPNYGEDIINDKIESYYFLELVNQISININGIESQISELQIIFQNTTNDKNYLPNDIYFVYGKLMFAHTGHHHSEILIIAYDIILSQETIIPLELPINENDDFWVEGKILILTRPYFIMTINNSFIAINFSNRELDEKINDLARRVYITSHILINGYFKIKYIENINIECIIDTFYNIPSSNYNLPIFIVIDYEL